MIIKYVVKQRKKLTEASRIKRNSLYNYVKSDEYKPMMAYNRNWKLTVKVKLLSDEKDRSPWEADNTHLLFILNIFFFVSGNLFRLPQPPKRPAKSSAKPKPYSLHADIIPMRKATSKIPTVFIVEPLMELMNRSRKKARRNGVTIWPCHLI